ncbi:flagellar hook-associated protein 3 FlgL [Alkalithermobacter thermoalcaliphilus JW-YL-7 = DSM 7308]|uniref:Flagellar hook-associated protein 3 n=1 Tax=Alkalithermobacter thermoalcaliphilus JW-YL-7 = DSM 7308 TaxID=1121328 RepID=A0A150FPV9_CLOPD|nr:flagellar hook-associated protein 3 [[Clostridium] paradoxum JW-YL-7 = DSM 7308]SHL05874.1 flagellar hook-associated protein 3 FlgL [[Clostridium] paradoxum JW-YL-7 = DSM 7308]
MRITNSMMINRMTMNMSNNLKRMSKVQHDLASGVKIHRPSDDPILVSRTLKIRTDISQNDQFNRNVSDAYSVLEKTEHSLNEINSVLQRIRELTVQASNGTMTPDDLDKIKAEVVQLKDHLIRCGNDTYVGRHIFSGYSTEEKLLNEDGSINSKIDYNKLKDQHIEYQVGISATVKVNLTGIEVFGDIQEEGKPKLISDIDKLIKRLEQGDNEQVSKSIQDIDDNISNILRLKGDVGARISTIEVIRNRIEDTKINFTKLLSETEDTDMGEAIMYLNMYESVYKASLAIGARIIQPTLVDFLR